MFTQYTNYVRKNVGTTAASLVICPAAQQLVVNQLSCANITNQAVTCSVTLTRGANTIFIVDDATVYPGGSLLCAGHDQKIVLMAGDNLQVQSSVANSIDAMVSGLLTDSTTVPAVPAVVVGTNATISVAAGVTVVVEAGTVTFTVTTSLPNGTVVYWENIGSTNAQDFTDDRNSGSVAVSGGTATFTRTLRATLASVDLVGEGSETIIMGVGTVPRYLGGGVLAVSGTVTVLDSPVLSGLIMNLDAGNPASYSGSGATWTDFSGSGNNATLANSPTYASTNGGIITFNSTNQNAVVANSASLKNNSVTIDLIMRNNGTLAGDIVQFGVGSGSFAQYYFRSFGGNTYWDYFPVGASSYGEVSVSNATHFPSGAWVHVALTGESSGAVKMYINGLAVGAPSLTTTTPVASWTPAALTIGGFTWDGFTPTTIPLVRIYNRSLSASEIQNNFNSVRSRFGL